MFVDRLAERASVVSARTHELEVLGDDFYCKTSAHSVEVLPGVGETLRWYVLGDL